MVLQRMLFYRKRLRFFDQLTLMITVAVGVLAISISIITSWVINNRIHTLFVENIFHITEQFAAHSAFVLLAHQPTLAHRAIGNIESVPGVHAAAILNRELSILAPGDGDIDISRHTNSSKDDRATRLAMEDDDYWHFISPVYTRSRTSPYVEKPTASKVLGFVYIIWRKERLTTTKVLVFAILTVTSLSVGFVVMMWLRKRVKELTTPLSELYHVMHKAHSGNDVSRANIVGPEETQEIAKVFNNLMGKVERQKAMLESEVQVRTLELSKARDAALIAERYKTELMAAFTHEMRTPLTAIAAYGQLTVSELEFVKEREIVSKIQRFQEIILSEASSLLLRINQILDLTSMEAGKLEVKPTNTDIGKMLKGIRETVSPLAISNRNCLRIDHKGVNQVRIDEDKLGQILINIIANACKFTRDGYVTIQSTCDGKEYRAVVVDSGIGIPSEQLADVFEPFRQIDMSETRAHKGTGLGLAIAKRFTELMGGTITINSKRGQGTSVAVTIPKGLI